MSKLCDSESAIELLTALGMTEDDAFSALDFAEDSGEYRSREFSVVCRGRNLFEIERR